MSPWMTSISPASGADPAFESCSQGARPRQRTRNRESSTLLNCSTRCLPRNPVAPVMRMDFMASWVGGPGTSGRVCLVKSGRRPPEEDGAKEPSGLDLLRSARHIGHEDGGK